MINKDIKVTIILGVAITAAMSIICLFIEPVCAIITLLLGALTTGIFALYTKKRYNRLNELNNYPMMATHAHTRPFKRRWLNIITGLTLPVGLFFYLRMCRFRLRLMRDLKAVRRANSAITERIRNMENA